MENQVALENENNAGGLYFAFELSRKKWKLGFVDGKAPQVRQVTIKSFDLELERLRCWNGEAISAQLCQRIQDEYHRLQLVELQIRESKAKQTEQLRAEQKTAALEKVHRLQQLLESEWVLAGSSSWNCLDSRQFQNRRELAAAVGLTPTPYNSGYTANKESAGRATGEYASY